MISKRIATHAKNDNYRRLANYIAGNEKQQQKELEHGREYIYKPNIRELGNLAGKCLRKLSEWSLVHRTLGKGKERESASILSFDARPDNKPNQGLRWNKDNTSTEKCLISWAAGCWAGDDYQLAIQEVASTQALNTRTTKEKTYHLMISFRPEDQGKLKPEDFKAIEERFAETLGLAEHQRHCGVHVNTENTHLHIAYNLIHPEKLTRVEPWRDFIARDKLCREIEKEYGLTIDTGREKSREDRKSNLAASMEAHSGQQSFEGFAQEQAKPILEKLETAQTWEELHQEFARHGLVLERRGAGLVVKDRHGKQRAKASTMNREFSLKKLEKRFGKFEAPDKANLPKSETRYGAKPLQQKAQENALWQEFQAMREAQTKERENIKAKWQEYRAKLDKMILGSRSRNDLLRLARQKESQQRQQLDLQHPANWLDFLQEKARAGDENALAVLRSRKVEVQPMQRVQEEKEKKQAKADFLAQKTAIMESNVSAKGKRQLISQALIRSQCPDVKTEVTKHGHLVFTLPSGEKICDTGSRITFSEGARTEALAYMAASWGIKRMEKDREGKPVFVLPDGQKIHDKGNREFERPKPKPQRERGKGFER